MVKALSYSEWSKMCSVPDCLKIIYYSTKYTLKNAIDNNTKCKSCSNKGELNGMYGKTGELNHFYGKVHTVETRSHLSEIRFTILKTMSQQDKDTLLAQLKVAREVHQSNPARSNYEIWLDKYGEVEAEERHTAFKSKLSTIFSGEGNPMFGRSPGTGSGGGWGGWFNGDYFRSLGELAFMLDHPDAVSGERDEWRAEYEDEFGIKRTTVPDFILRNDKIVVECKPLALQGTANVQLRADALNKLATLQGYSFEMLDPGKVSEADLNSLILSGRVVLNKHTEKRFEKWKSNHKK